MTEDASAVRVTIEDQVLRAVIDRPSTRNAINLAVIAGLESMIDTAQRTEAKVLVLRGAGRTFCSGADLHELRRLIDSPAALRSFMARFGAILQGLEQAPWITLAAVEGYAVAGGCELLLSCDIVVTAADSRIGDGHVEYGLVPAGGASVRMPQAMPGAFARYLLLTGEHISGAEAAQKGLAAIAVEPQALDAEIERIVARLRSRGRGTLHTIKAMLAAGRDEPNRPYLRRELDLFLEHVGQGPDARAGLDAFHNRIAASFEETARPRA